MRKKLGSVVVWSVISAAFIGPGTVTTAVTAGSKFQLDLLWAVLFATLACILVQEIAARIALASGHNLGQTLVLKFGHRKGLLLQFLIGGGVIFGCAAYEAGNILGAVAGLNLITQYDTQLLTIMVTIAAGLILLLEKRQWISGTMLALVAIMGIAFLILSFTRSFSFEEVLYPVLQPTLPPNSELLVLGLIGTTIVPYNIFLGSGISRGQTIPLMRTGLTISVLIGGLITAAILVAGTTVSDFSSFQNLHEAFHAEVGSFGAFALATGLFAAGFSSAITSPYAASVISATVFGWKKAKYIRLTWGLVLLSGFIFGISGVHPIPVILAVQALNGLILPLLVAFLIIIANDPEIMPSRYRPSAFYSILLLLIFGFVLAIGLNNIGKVMGTVFSVEFRGGPYIVLSLSVLVLFFLARKIFKVAKR